MMHCICQKGKGETQFLLSGNIRLNQQGQRRRVSVTIANEISNVTFSVMPTCLPAGRHGSVSFFKKDSLRVVDPTSGNDNTKELCQLFVLTLNTDNAPACKGRLAEPRYSQPVLLRAWLV